MFGTFCELPCTARCCAESAMNQGGGGSGPAGEAGRKAHTLTHTHTPLTQTLTHTHNTHAQSHTHTHMHTHTCTHTLKHTCTHTHTHTCTHTHTHAHTHTCTHTHMHTHTNPTPTLVEHPVSPPFQARDSSHALPHTHTMPHLTQHCPSHFTPPLPHPTPPHPPYVRPSPPHLTPLRCPPPRPPGVEEEEPPSPAQSDDSGIDQGAASTLGDGGRVGLVSAMNGDVMRVQSRPRVAESSSRPGARSNEAAASKSGRPSTSTTGETPDSNSCTHTAIIYGICITVTDYRYIGLNAVEGIELFMYCCFPSSSPRHVALFKAPVSWPPPQA